MGSPALLSPLCGEALLRSGQAGRADQFEIDQLRGDFMCAIESLLLPGERLQRFIAIRPDRILSRDVPACVLALTTSALLYLHEPLPSKGSRYGMRSTVVPLRGIAGVGLGEQLLRGYLTIVTTGQTTHEIPYHVLDDDIFQQLLREIRSVAFL